MRQTIPFNKDITFKTKIGEITSISLDNDLMLQGEDLIKGNFYISGTYKMLESSTILEDYSYKIPCEIAISNDYDTFDSSVDIDDFNYEIVDDEILRINIVVAINDLKKKPIEEKESLETEILDDDLFEDKELDRAIEICDKTNEETEKEEKTKSKTENRNENKVSFYDVKENVKKQTDTYLTYKVYILKEGDSIENITEKYKVTREDLLDYNDLENLIVGSKIIIPSSND